MDPAVVAAARLAAVEKRTATAAKKAASKQDRVPASNMAARNKAEANNKANEEEAK